MAQRSVAMDINVTELRRLGKKGHGLKFGRKKIKSVGGREGFRRSSRLLGSCASGPSTPRRPSTPRLPIMLLAAGVLECPDILNQVLALLGPLDLARCAAVCRQWNSEAHAATLWKPLCEVRCAKRHYQDRLGTHGGWPVKAVTLNIATHAIHVSLPSCVIASSQDIPE